MLLTYFKRVVHLISRFFFCFLSLFPTEGLNFNYMTIHHQPLCNCIVMIIKFIWLGEILFFSSHVEVIVELGIEVRFEYLTIHCSICRLDM